MASKRINLRTGVGRSRKIYITHQKDSFAEDLTMYDGVVVDDDQQVATEVIDELSD